METLYKDQLVSKGFLVAEHITSDLSAFCATDKSVPITLENLQYVKSNPFMNMQNLVIGDHLEK